METRLILSYTHFSLNSNSQRGRMKLITKIHKEIKVSEKYAHMNHHFNYGIVRVNKYTDSIKLTASKKTSFDPFIGSIEGRFDESSNSYIYFIQLKYKGETVDEKTIINQSPLKLHMQQSDFLEYQNADVPIDLISTEREHADRWYPFRLTYEDGLLSFTDPEGSGYSHSHRVKTTTIEQVPALNIFIKLYTSDWYDSDLKSNTSSLNNLIYQLTNTIDELKGANNRYIEVRSKLEAGEKLETSFSMTQIRFQIHILYHNLDILLNGFDDNVSEMFKRLERGRSRRNDRMLNSLNMLYQIRDCCKELFLRVDNDVDWVIDHMDKLFQLDLHQSHMSRIRNIFIGIERRYHPLDNPLQRYFEKKFNLDTVIESIKNVIRRDQNELETCFWRSAGYSNHQVSRLFNVLLSAKMNQHLTVHLKGHEISAQSSIQKCVELKNYTILFSDKIMKIVRRSDSFSKCTNLKNTSLKWSNSVHHVYATNTIWFLCRSADFEEDVYFKLIKISFTDETIQKGLQKFDLVHNISQNYYPSIDFYEDKVFFLSRIKPDNLLCIYRVLESGDKLELVKSVTIKDLLIAAKVEDPEVRRLPSPFTASDRVLIGNWQSILVRYAFDTKVNGVTAFRNNTELILYDIESQKVQVLDVEVFSPESRTYRDYARPYTTSLFKSFTDKLFAFSYRIRPVNYCLHGVFRKKIVTYIDWKGDKSMKDNLNKRFFTKNSQNNSLFANVIDGYIGLWCLYRSKDGGTVVLRHNKLRIVV